MYVVNTPRLLYDAETLQYVSLGNRGVSHRTRPQTGDTGSNLGALDEVKNEVIATEVSHIATEVSHLGALDEVVRQVVLRLHCRREGPLATQSGRHRHPAGPDWRRRSGLQ